MIISSYDLHNIFNLEYLTELDNILFEKWIR